MVDILHNLQKFNQKNKQNQFQQVHKRTYIHKYKYLL